MPRGTRTRRAAPVPPSAAALVDLLNSRPYAGMADKLDDQESAERILRPFGHEAGPPSPRRLDLVRALRSDLLGLVDSDAGAAARGWAAFSGRVASVTSQQDFSTPGRVELRQVGGDPVVGRITRAVAETVAAGNWSRIRVCAGDTCREAFYDTTRSRTRRWHSYEICGNRTNVAAYRARHAGGGARRG